MVMSVLQIAESLFQPQHLVIASDDPGEVVRSCTQALRPHQLTLKHRRGQIATRLHHLPMGPVSINRLCYGGEVTVAPVTPEEDTFLITLPLTGRAHFAYGSLETAVSPGHGAIIGPYHEFKLDIDASFDQLILRLDRQRVEAVCASMLGSLKLQPVHFKLSFEDLPAFLLTLVETAASLSAFGNALAYPKLFYQLEELVIETLLLTQPNNYSAGISGNVGEAPSVQIRRVMEYMREHITEPLRLSEVARQCGLSLRSLQLGFQRDLAGCGNTPLLKQGPSLCAATAAQFSALRNFNANPACFSMV